MPDRSGGNGENHAILIIVGCGSLVLGYWGIRDMKSALENYQLAVQRDPRFGEYKTLNERTAEWTPLERRAIHETYVLWSKAWRP